MVDKKDKSINMMSPSFGKNKDCLTSDRKKGKESINDNMIENNKKLNYLASPAYSGARSNNISINQKKDERFQSSGKRGASSLRKK